MVKWRMLDKNLLIRHHHNVLNGDTFFASCCHIWCGIVNGINKCFFSAKEIWWNTEMNTLHQKCTFFLFFKQKKKINNLEAQFKLCWEAGESLSYTNFISQLRKITPVITFWEHVEIFVRSGELILFVFLILGCRRDKDGWTHVASSKLLISVSRRRSSLKHFIKCCHRNTQSWKFSYSFPFIYVKS